jgi:predicted ribosome quality control (RQC) complex YloA/Tae2 family protein
MTKYREFKLSTGTKILLGKDAENNDELMKEFKGKENLILHTVKPGSPFCVIISDLPTGKEVKESAIICASKSQDWRDNKSNVDLHLFSGREIKKPLFAKTGTWNIKSKPKIIKVKKADIEKHIKKEK